MIGEFIFNDVPSSTFNLVCKSIKRPLLPALRPSRVQVGGISGSYVFDSYDYDLRSITMRITYVGDDFEELRTRARDIAAWLSTPNFEPLIINDESDKYYLAQISTVTDLTTLQEAGQADLIFDCQPFALAVDKEEYTYEDDDLINRVSIIETNECLNPKPIHVANAAPDNIIPVEFENLTAVWSDGAVVEAVVTSKKLSILGLDGTEQTVGLTLKAQGSIGEIEEDETVTVVITIGDLAQSGCTLRPVVRWIDADDELISFSPGSAYSVGAGFTEYAATFSAPEDASMYSVHILTANDFHVGDTLEFSFARIAVKKNKDNDDYFDGSYGDCRWEGTEDASRSFWDEITYSPITCTFNNSGNRIIDFRSPPGSMSNIKITGYWDDLLLSMNGVAMEYTSGEIGIGPGGPLIFDNVNMTLEYTYWLPPAPGTPVQRSAFAWLSSGTRNFFQIIPGDNTLVISGTNLVLTRVVVEFIPLWI